MNLTYKRIKTEVSKLNKLLCKEVKATDDGKKFSLLMIRKLSGNKGIKLKNSYCDYGGDHQIDGIYFNEGGDDFEINVLTCKFASKENDCIADKDVTDLINNGLSYLLFGEEKVKDFNSKIKNNKEQFDDLREAYKEKYAVKIKFLSTSEKVLSENGKSNVGKFISDAQKNGVNIEYEELNAKKLSALFSSKANIKTEIPIKLSGKSYYPLSGREGFVCRLPALEIVNMYYGCQEGKSSYPGYGEYLFEENIRKNLGLEKKINENMYKTSTDKSTASEFEYFNNGLTILYDDRRGNLAQDSPILYLKGVQVVNGCQTVSTLIKAYDDKALCEDVYIMCRFIKRSEDEVFIRSVVTFTNSQNAISDRDLHANDRIQYDIQGILRNIGIYYERKLNEYRDENDDVRLDALDAAQAYLSCQLQKPQDAKQKKRRIFSEMYGKIFDATNQDLAYRLFISFKVLEYVLERQDENRRRKKETKKSGKNPRFSVKDLIVFNGAYHVAAGIYRDVYLSMPPEQVEKKAKRFVLPNKIEDIYDNVVAEIERALKRDKVKREDIPKHFKITGVI